MIQYELYILVCGKDSEKAIDRIRKLAGGSLIAIAKGVKEDCYHISISVSTDIHDAETYSADIMNIREFIGKVDDKLKNLDVDVSYTMIVSVSGTVAMKTSSNYMDINEFIDEINSEHLKSLMIADAIVSSVSRMVTDKTKENTLERLLESLRG